MYAGGGSGKWEVGSEKEERMDGCEDVCLKHYSVLVDRKHYPGLNMTCIRITIKHDSVRNCIPVINK